MRRASYQKTHPSASLLLKSSPIFISSHHFPPDSGTPGLPTRANLPDISAFTDERPACITAIKQPCSPPEDTLPCRYAAPSACHIPPAFNQSGGSRTPAYPPGKRQCSPATESKHHPMVAQLTARYPLHPAQRTRRIQHGGLRKRSSGKRIPMG